MLCDNELRHTQTCLEEDPKECSASLEYLTCMTLDVWPAAGLSLSESPPMRSRTFPSIYPKMVYDLTAGSGPGAGAFLGAAILNDKGAFAGAPAGAFVE